MRGVRLYGVTRTNTSWGRVTDGVRAGLDAIGAFAGFVPVDARDHDAIYTGADAPTAIYVGPPSMVAAMTSYGMHERRYAIVAPNSSWLPQKLVSEMLKYTAIVAPSTWGASVVERYTGRRIAPYLHGVSRLFQPIALGVTAGAVFHGAEALWSEGRFRVLHLASTPRQRKGTRELIAAWNQAANDSLLGANPELDIIVDAPEGTFGRTHPSIRFPYRQLNAPAEKMRALMGGYHLVCQPSRAEGFGLTPLEARACGVPVCATACTGHADHMPQGPDAAEAGVVVVPTGPDASVDDAPEGEMSRAPSLDPQHLLAALVQCYEQWPQLHEAARAAAADVGRAWSWPRVTEQWLRTEGITWT